MFTSFSTLVYYQRFYILLICVILIASTSCSSLNFTIMSLSSWISTDPYPPNLQLSGSCCVWRIGYIFPSRLLVYPVLACQSGSTWWFALATMIWHSSDMSAPLFNILQCFGNWPCDTRFSPYVRVCYFILPHNPQISPKVVKFNGFNFFFPT